MDEIKASKAFLDSTNELLLGNAPAGSDLLTPRGILSALLPYLFVFAGLILFAMIIWGGFEIMSGAATPKSQDAGKARITNAMVGFVLLFCSYWFAQIVEIVFGISIL